MKIIPFDGMKKYHTGFDRPGDVTEIVLHGTGGSASAAGLLKWMADGGRADEYRKGIALFHYLIDFNGDVYRLIPDDRWVYHSSSGSHDMLTIGIEHMNASATNADEYTDAQYAASIGLVKQLIAEHPQIATIVGHGQNKLKFSKAYKTCPGKYDWHRLHDALGETQAWALTKEKLTREVIA